MTNKNSRRIDSVAMSQMDDATLTRWAGLEPVLTPLEAELIRRWNDFIELHSAVVEAVEYHTEDPADIERAFDIADKFDNDEETAEDARRALTFVRNQENFDAPVDNLLKLRERLLDSPPAESCGFVRLPAREYESLMFYLRDLDSEFYEAIKG